jgi:hypothetical protein
MNEYRHHVSGFFAVCDEARLTLYKMVERGIPAERLRIYETDLTPSAPVPKEDSNAVLKDVVVDGAIGTAVGTGLGALAEVALVAANVSLFIASPLIAPLAMLGWGAAIGGVIGATAGATKAPEPGTPTQTEAEAGAEARDGWLSELVRDAIANGQIVLVADTRTPQETATAKAVIEASVGGAQDVDTA